MLDRAGLQMSYGDSIACERKIGVNDNMSKPHFHDYFELYYLENGERYHMIDNKIYHLTARQFILFPPFVMHYSYGDDDVEFHRLLIYFREEEIDDPNLLAWLKQCNKPFIGDVAESQIIRRTINYVLFEQEHPSDYSNTFKHSFVNLLAVELARFHQEHVAPESNNRIALVLDHIHDHYMENLTIEELANVAYISQYHLCREFKKQTSQTIIQYINMIRTMNAQRRLVETDMKITEISKQMGFSNVTHFNRVFKQTTGISPSEYRKTKSSQA